MEEMPDSYIGYIISFGSILLGIALFFLGKSLYNRKYKKYVSPYLNYLIQILWPFAIISITIVGMFYLRDIFVPKVPFITVEIINSSDDVVIKKFKNYFETSSGKRIWASQGGYWIYNNTHECLVKEWASYSDNNNSSPFGGGIKLDTIARPGDIFRLECRPDYWLQPLPGTVSFQNTHVPKSKQTHWTTKSAIYLESQSK